MMMIGATGQAGADGPGGTVPAMPLGRVRCVNCQEDLTGAERGSACAGCRAPVRVSYERFLLMFSERADVRRLWWGVVLLLTGTGLGLLAQMGGALGVILGVAGSSGLGLVAAGLLLAGVLTVAACWMLSRPERQLLRVEGTAANWRQWLWTAGVTAVVLDVALAASLALVLAQREGAGGTSMVEVVLLLGAMLTIPVAPVLIIAVDLLVVLAMLNFMVLLAQRVPDDWLVSRARLYRWLLPAITLLGLPAAWLWGAMGGRMLSATLRGVDPGAVLVLFSGLVIAGVMYLNLLDRLRRHLGAILRGDEVNDDGSLA